MKRLSLRFLAPLTVALSAVASAAYNPAIVSADARWVVHADFNGLRSSQLGQELITALEKAQMGANGGIIGVNVPKLLSTIGAVTAYGTNLTADPAAIDGALIAQGTVDLRKIAESALLQGTLAEPNAFSEIADMSFPVYAISDPKAAAGNQTQVLIAFPPEPIIIVSKSRAQLTKARDVFRGSAPSLAKAGQTQMNQLAASADGAYLFAASMVPTEQIFPEKAPQARILQLTKSGALSVGEHGSEVFAHLQLTASSDRNAEKLTKILEGMTSMFSLAESNDKQLAEFLNGTSVTREKDMVSLKLSYPAARLIQMAQTLQSSGDPKPAARPASITVGKVVAEWTANDVESEQDDLTWRTVEDVALMNGSLITLGRALNGGRDVRFDRVEVVPAGGGQPLIFRRELMRSLRGTMMQLAFPGADGKYTIRVAYRNDPTQKAKFALSVQEPRSHQQK